MANEVSPVKPALRKGIRERILGTASALFYANGVRAVGMEEIVARSGIAKTTIYRHFPTKDVLIEAFLKREDEEFWQQWDAVISGLSGPHAIDALCEWIGSRVQRDGYRGCPQINAAAEFADVAHPSRAVAHRHKEEMCRRLTLLCEQGGIPDAADTAMQLALLFDGAFMSGDRLKSRDAATLLKEAARKLLGNPATNKKAAPT
jgi:AcrR family transcriptional regulator